MTHKQQFSILPAMAAWLLTAVFCLFKSPQAQAQRVAYKSTLPRLQTKVHLSLGTTTAARAVASLSAQTSLKIEITASLRQHVLNIDMEDVVCKAALDALAELNDWKWEEIGEGHILFSRRVSPTPQKMTDVPPAMIAALPKDWRTYLYVDVPWQEVMRASGTTSTRFGPSYVHDAMNVRSARLLNHREEALLASLAPPLKKGDRLPYRKLTPEQRDALLTVLFLRALNETSYGLLQNRLKPFQLDFTQATMEIRGANFFIGTHTEEGKAKNFDYFGIQIIGKYTLPNPASDPLAPELHP